MKTKLLITGLFLVMMTGVAQAQYVKLRAGFPVGIHIGPPHGAPYAGAVWMGPEWQWRSGRYVSVPGYWTRPGRYGAVWVPGHWKHSRRGYRWIPGHWR